MADLNVFYFIVVILRRQQESYEEHKGGKSYCGNKKFARFVSK